jgi:hypothetical protein
MVQVSVQARSGIEADVLSTAMLVAGREFEGVERWWGDRPTAETGNGEQGEK